MISVKNSLLLLMMFLILVFASVANADTAATESETTFFDVFKEAVPNTTPGLFYSRNGHEANFITEGTLISKETKFGTFSLDAAYGESDLGLGIIAYKTETLSKLGVNVFILKDIFAKVGYGVGYNHITKSDRKETDGPTVTFGANIKFGPQGK